ncbi:zinc ribbon domain-containing protein [Microbulbifer sp. ANSA003]|uniref:zinc ribbon domain-containing protein n=1 Tax=Microbulbifer sp. ANSA003 TaxID=3243360 RepID=UPI0040435FB1
MLDTIWDYFQQREIDDARYRSQNAKQMAANLELEVGDIQGRIDTLVLANQAMWELLSERLGVTEAELIEKMGQIDLRDGKRDGKISTGNLKECPSCGHKVRKQRANCYWCGTELTLSSPFMDSKRTD